MTILVLERLGGAVLIFAGLGYVAFSARGPAVEGLLRRSWILRGVSRVLLGTSVLTYSAGWLAPAVVVGAVSVVCLVAAWWCGVRPRPGVQRRAG